MRAHAAYAPTAQAAVAAKHAVMAAQHPLQQPPSASPALMEPAPTSAPAPGGITPSMVVDDSRWPAAEVAPNCPHFTGSGRAVPPSRLQMYFEVSTFAHFPSA